MRKTIIVAGTVLVLGLVLAGCGDNGNGNNEPPVNNPPPPAPGATELSLSGRVYSLDWSNGWFDTVRFTPFPTGQTRTVFGEYGGTGAIANGQLSFTIGIPTSLEHIGRLWFPGEESVTFDPPETQAAPLRLGTRAPSETQDSGYLFLLYFRDSVSGTSFSSEVVDRSYIYVDRDVVVRLAQDQTEEDEWEGTENGTTFNRTFITRAFTLTLREGWNVVHSRRVSSGSFVGPVANPTSITETVTETVTTADPGRQLRWTLDEWRDYSETLDLSRGALPVRPGTSPFGTRR